MNDRWKTVPAGRSKHDSAAADGNHTSHALAKRCCQLAKLRYSTDTSRGISRRRKGTGFYYLGPAGIKISQAAILERIRLLSIPPAWRDVWICTDPRGHLQATGFDARGRKQYRYHAEWRRIRDLRKFDRLIQFGMGLNALRRRVNQYLRERDHSREKVLAAAIRLLDITHARVGGESYARENRTFGVTTLRDRHVRTERGKLVIQFRGKSGVDHRLVVDDPVLAKVIRQCAKVPGSRLLQSQEGDRGVHAISSAEVNAAIREWTNSRFTAKEFRTWSGSVLFIKAATTSATAILSTRKLIGEVAEQLRNTPAVCRKHYIHPGLLAGHEDHSLSTWWGNANTKRRQARRHLSAAENRLLEWMSEQAGDRS